MCRTVDDFHISGIVILVKTLTAMSDSQTAIQFRIVLGAIATQLKPIGIATIGKVRQVLA